ncbi:hypothetical protein BGZ94_003761, partial [Podila epigama]
MGAETQARLCRDTALVQEDADDVIRRSNLPPTIKAMVPDDKVLGPIFFDPSASDEAGIRFKVTMAVGRFLDEFSNPKYMTVSEGPWSDDPEASDDHNYAGTLLWNSLKDHIKREQLARANGAQ